MANWKRLQDVDEVLGLPILLRESYKQTDNVNYVAGTLERTVYDTLVLKAADVRMEIYPGRYDYHYICIDEIKF